MVGVVELDPIPAIPNLEAFDGDPTNGLLPALFRLEFDAAAPFAIHDGLLAGDVLKDDGPVRFTRKAQEHESPIYPTTDQNDVSCPGDLCRLLNGPHR